MDIEDRVYKYLLDNHYGKDNLIKNRVLRSKFNINSDKSMRKVIQNIRENKKYSYIVGSISGKSGGFFICENEEQELNTIYNIKHRANQMLRLVHVLYWKKDQRIKDNANS